MKKVAVSMSEALREKRLRSNLSTLEAIHMDGLNDLHGIQADLRHLETVFSSIQDNYLALLEQNRRLKAMLLHNIDRCYCWPGNRCDRCTDIMQLLAEYD